MIKDKQTKETVDTYDNVMKDLNSFRTCNNYIEAPIINLKGEVTKDRTYTFPQLSVCTTFLRAENSNTNMGKGITSQSLPNPFQLGRRSQYQEWGAAL